eukprot:16428451-Heterocapsa_arctica.AAC.1
MSTLAKHGIKTISYLASCFDTKDEAQAAGLLLQWEAARAPGWALAAGLHSCFPDPIGGRPSDDSSTPLCRRSDDNTTGLLRSLQNAADDTAEVTQSLDRNPPVHLEASGPAEGWRPRESQGELGFKSLAFKFGVPESEFFILLHAGIKSANDFFASVPTADRLEVFIEETIFLVQGIWEIGGDLHVEPRKSTAFPAVSVPRTWDSWARSSTAAAWRLLWQAS